MPPPFFFKGHGFIGGDGTETADLLVNLNQLLHQGLKATKLGNFLFRFVYGPGRRQSLRKRLACDFLREPSKWPVSGIIGLSTMTSRLPAASMDRRYGTGLKIPELREFLQEMATAVEQFGQGVGHGELQEMI